MKRILILLFLCRSFAYAQPVYQPHEVEKTVEPSGGLKYLNQFIISNIQIPFKSAVKGLNGRVYVKGIVEPDGSMTNLEVSRGLDSLCNQEAIRLLSLYKAWQPATIKGEKVRQSFTYAIVFKSAEAANFDTLASAFTDYFDDKFVPTSEPKKYKFRMIRPVDEQGYVRADVVSEQLKKDKWVAFASVPFKRNEFWYKLDYHENRRDSVRAYDLSARDENFISYTSEPSFQMNGKLLSYSENINGKKSLFKEYDLNGLLRKIEIYSDSSYSEIVWFDNGQVKSEAEKPHGLNMGFKGMVYVNLWDRDGKQLVENGNGLWKSQGAVLNDKMYAEEGLVKDGKKDGAWQGKLADSTLLYKEMYADGKLIEGVSFQEGEKVTYTESAIQPAFRGGLPAFYQYLAQNIKYPSEASRRGISGRVFLSFVVCEDGSLCDYKIIKGVGFGLDNEAMRVVKTMSGLWEPGKLRGRKVKVKYNMPINFQLN